MAVEIIGNLVTRDEIRAPCAIVPARAVDLERLDKIKKRDGINVILRGPHRSRQEEKFYRALINYVADGLGIHPDTLHAELRYKAGKIARIVNSNEFGASVELKSSVAMDRAEYDAYVRVAIDIIFADYLPGVRRKDVLDEVRKMVKPNA